jgi:hypothetical protein
MATTEDGKKAVLRIAIDEQRLVAQKLHEDYYQMKTRILTYLGGGLAVLTFLYSRADGTFIPDETYGKIFYFAGLGMMVMAISLLLYALTPAEWEVPTENVKLELLEGDNDLEYLAYVKLRYVACYKTNIRAYTTKQKLLNTSFFPLIFGAIILVVLNIFGG